MNSLDGLQGIFLVRFKIINASLKGGGAYNALAEELLAVDGCWREDS